MNAHIHPFGTVRGRHAGMTLIELLVAMIIGVVVSLAIFAVLSASEGRKRTTTSVNDINQSGNYSMYVVEKLLRSAGSGYSSGVTISGFPTAYPFGCAVYSKNAAGQVLPVPSTLPAPFAALDSGTGTKGLFRLAPVLIIPGGTTPSISGGQSDVLVIMAGASGGAQVATNFSNFPTASSLLLGNVIDFAANDVVMIADAQGKSTGVRQDCMIQQVASGTPSGTTLNLGGDYYGGTIGTATITNYSDQSGVFNLGNVKNGNPPTFALLGVGDNNTLYSYDLIRTTTDPLVPVADGVFEMHARYGIDTSGDGTIDQWVAPDVTTGDYTIANLMAGNEKASDSIRRIKAVRVGLILRTSLPERTDAAAGVFVAENQVQMFKDLATYSASSASSASSAASSGASSSSSSAGTCAASKTGDLIFTRCLTDAERAYRYRVIEATIPLRNML
ncbi:PilW family protein [Viridibacterium curvum]|uniref:Prepilin-type N-terminal cleavage/methylation domain-containing protein n=1 Tax=Viridibacterium curvum TaxID=1101404 RepID=A0ABP9Q744_9RHOO